MEEMLDVIDDEEKVLETLPKKEVIERHLLHKTVHVEIINSKGELLVGLRAPEKRIYPNQWDSGVSGHVASGESEEETAKREMKEEIGIGAEVEFLGKIRSRTSEVDELVYVYVAKSDGPFEAMEATELKTVAVEDAAFLSATPPFRRILSLLKEKKVI